jgi:hypothetical protein
VEHLISASLALTIAGILASSLVTKDDFCRCDRVGLAPQAAVERSFPGRDA